MLSKGNKVLLTSASSLCRVEVRPAVSISNAESRSAPTELDGWQREALVCRCIRVKKFRDGIDCLTRSGVQYMCKSLHGEISNDATSIGKNGALYVSLVRFRPYL